MQPSVRASEQRERMPEILSVRDVGFSYGGKRILHGVNLSVGAGDFLTIEGPSGSGKSTLLKLIASLLTPTVGIIEFDGRDMRSYPRPEYRRQVSYCFQQPTLFGTSVRDCLTFPFAIRNQRFDEDRARRSLSMMCLPEAMLDSRITQLSGGERQRIAVARNLLFTPRILLLDEVTTGLDATTKHVIHDLIARYNKRDGVTVLAVTHDETEIEAAEHLLTLDGEGMHTQR